MTFAGRVCASCHKERAAESNRAYQRKRRLREKNQRHLAAGLLKRKGTFLIECDIACAHCGASFRPERSSGRYCSGRCRAAAYRKAAAELAKKKSKKR
jgi:hypothetical protein